MSNNEIIKVIDNTTYHFIFPNMPDIKHLYEQEKNINSNYSDACEKDALSFIFSLLLFGVFFPFIYLPLSNALHFKTIFIVIGTIIDICALVGSCLYFYFRKHTLSKWNISELYNLIDLYDCLNSDTNIDTIMIFYDKKLINIIFPHKVFSYKYENISSINDETLIIFDNKFGEITCNVSVN